MQNNPSSESLEQQTPSDLARLQMVTDELTQSISELTRFVDKTGALLKCSSFNEALDVSDTLIMECVDFTYFKICLRIEEGGEIKEVRKLCPDEYIVDEQLVQWAIKQHDPMLIPLDPIEHPGESVLSLIIVPFTVGEIEMGYLALWVDFDHSNFTHFLSTLLRIYAQQFTATMQNLLLKNNLQQAKDLLVDIADSVPYAIFTVDAKGVITSINENTEFLFKVSREGAIGKRYSDVFSRKLSDAFRNFVNSLMGGRELGEQEIEYSLDDGTLLTIGLNIAPLRQSGGHQNGFVLMCRDLRLTREVVKLRELGAMKDDFISLVSHELRTPLSAIMAYSETLLMDGIIQSEEERREYLEIIHNEGDRLSRLINDILDLSKMESGKMTYHFDESDIYTVIHVAMMNFDNAAKQKKIFLQEDVPEGLPSVRMDSDRIMQVMMNLLSNAIKFTDEGGKVFVQASHTPATSEHNGFLQVSVKDSGCGIAPENYANVFNKFEQVENIRHHTGGTGLGMPICRQIIEDGHGGKIWLESQLGVGTTFFFTLPL